MTEIAKQARALLDEVSAEARRGTLACRFLPEAGQVIVAEALLRALEEKAALQTEFDQALTKLSYAETEFEQHKRDVSAKVEQASLLDLHGTEDAFEPLRSLILPKSVDPLVEALCCCVPLTSEQGNETPAEYVARSVRKWLADQGLKIKIVEAE